VDAEVLMKPIWTVTVVLVLLFSQACSRTDVSTESSELDRSCRVVIAATADGDTGIASLQRNLRERSAPARAAEQLGFRFVARARLSNDAGLYKVAEQGAACVYSLAPGEPDDFLLGW
jgi:hypothetical protein